MPPPTPDDIVGLDMMIRGQVVVPGSVLFEGEAKKQHSAIFHSNKPALYVLCKDITDVQEALRFVTKHGMQLSIRSGGHSICGSSIRDGSVVVDVGCISDVDYDEDSELLTVGPGATLGDMNVYLLRRGRMTPIGAAPTVRAGGLILHGGVGWLTHRFGTSVDNVMALTIVLADGTVKNLDHSSTGYEKELFCAARGAGGVMGIVTSITLRTYPMESVTGGFWVMLDDENYTKTREYVKLCRDLVLEQEKNGSRKLFGGVYMTNLPPEESIPEQMHGQPCTLFNMACWGTEDEAKDLMSKLSDGDIIFGKAPGPMPFNVFNQIMGGVFLKFPPFGTYWKAPMTTTLANEDIDKYCDKYVHHEPWLNGGFAGFEFQGGEQGRLHGNKINEGNDNCVASLRSYLFSIPSYLYFPPGKDNLERARALACDMASVFEDQRVASYSNCLFELKDEADRARETELCFPDAAQLSKTKQSADPHNLFTRSVISVSPEKEALSQ
eukprot:CAMPEP_0197441264 /NCGR_PEP_ID=MMETSP1175-20131217/7575_1 /TAXON_ID=1003142 /ORGANISM="Triceratium dubium, Strain CCMP147" /LENGTH=495 /DNA_ID=CAMNT_0042971511 /DNA_START=104 /DNA_END=1591 /DNA_ORIENTATION=+